MLKKCIVLLFIMAAANSLGAASVVLQPRLGAGLSYNDNIDQVSTNAVGSGAALFYSGITLAGHFGPDLSYSLSFDQSGENYLNKDFGGFQSSYGNIGFSYDLLPRLKIGYDYDTDLFIDSAYSDSNYTANSYTPEITYQFTENININILNKLSHLKYQNISENVTYTEKGGYLSSDLSSWLNIKAGYFNIESVSTTENSYYKGNELQLLLSFLTAEEDCFTVCLAESNLAYPDWPIGRRDKKTSMKFGFNKALGDSLAWDISFEAITNASPEEDYSYKNNVLSMALNYEPTFGKAYDHGAESELEYYYEAALVYIEKGNDKAAEKQLRKVLVFVDDFAEVNFELGYILHRRKDYQGAIKEFEKAIELDPEMIEAYYLLAYDHINYGDEKKALRILRELYKKTKDELVLEIMESLKD
jgi:tetratricopeptide (TPR) repeat protein